MTNKKKYNLYTINYVYFLLYSLHFMEFHDIVRIQYIKCVYTRIK